MSARTDAIRIQLAGLTTEEHGTVVSALIAMLDASGLARAGSAWFSRLDEIAKLDPVVAGGLASALWAHLARHRPESPAPLDHGFEPTEAERDPRGTP